MEENKSGKAEGRPNVVLLVFSDFLLFSIFHIIVAKHKCELSVTHNIRVSSVLPICFLSDFPGCFLSDFPGCILSDFPGCILAVSCEYPVARERGADAGGADGALPALPTGATS